MKLQELVKNWLKEAYESKKIKYRTYARYRDIYEQHIETEFGSREIRSIRPDELKAYIAKKKKNGNLKTGQPLSSSSLNCIISVLKSSYNYAIDKEMVNISPCDRLKRVSTEEKKITAFTVKEQRAIENFIDASGDFRLFGIKLCMYTGLRIGELLALTWEDVDLQSGIIFITKTVYAVQADNGKWIYNIDKPKSSSSEREIPVPPTMLKELKQIKRENKAKYIIHQNGEMMYIRTYQFLFESMQKKLKIKQKGFHSLRHTFVTRALECGMDFKTISDIVGINLQL